MVLNRAIFILFLFFIDVYDTGQYKVWTLLDICGHYSNISDASRMHIW